jgi:hypothetical protein
MTTPIKTYDCQGCHSFCYGGYHMEEDKDGYGDWVRKEDHDKALESQAATIAALTAEVERLKSPVRFDTPEWTDCETRGPMVRNSLKHRISELMIAERRCRSAYTQAYMRGPFTWLADAYAEAIEALETRHAALSQSKEPR